MAIASVPKLYMRLTASSDPPHTRILMLTYSRDVPLSLTPSPDLHHSPNPV